MTPPLVVRVTNRLRLAGALLAAGGWPAQEQAAKAYQPHRVAEAARRFFAPYGDHPAVRAAEAAGPHRLYADAADEWSSDLAEPVARFEADAQAEEFWATTQPAWQQAEADLSAVLGGANLPAFLETLFGALPATLVVYPNLLYPGREPLALEAGGELVICQPPPLAWGTSPPWRYSERPDEVVAVLATTAAAHLFERRLPKAHAALRPHARTFALAAAVLCLRAAEGQAAGDQFLVMEKKARRLPQLPYVVAALEAAVEARPGGLGDYVAGLPLAREHP